MAYKTILMHLNDQQRFQGVMQTGLRLARANGGHLVGLAVMPPIIIVPGTESDAGAVIEDHREQYRPHITHMREAFAAAIKQAGVSGEWVELDCESESPFGDVGSVAVAQARNADLVITSAENPSWSFSGHLDVPEPLIMETGRPVLLLPNPPVPSEIGKRVMVAWNGSRESVRAAFDAIPLLKGAEAVMIAQVGESAKKGGAGGAPGSGLGKVLARHDIKCEAMPPLPEASNIGAALLDAAQRGGADLLVMGCYGHSRLRELFLGGASRHMLQHLRIPVLMSH